MTIRDWRVLLVIGLAASALACGNGVPAVLTDAEEAEVYRRILTTIARDHPGSHANVVHSYLAVARDSNEALTTELHTFEYQPSTMLQALAADDTTVALCTPDARGQCGVARYLVLSQLTRTGARDAIVVARTMDRAVASRPRALVVRLRHGRDGWAISDASAARM